MGQGLKTIKADELPSLRRDAVDAQTLAQAAVIVADVEKRGKAALLEYAERFGDWRQGDPLIYDKQALQKALDSLDASKLELLKRTAKRIGKFAKFQKDALPESTAEIDGGQAGQMVAAVDRAACYAPGGRYPLPSSVLMTAVTARAAGVKEVWVASPKPTIETLAAAGAAEADFLLAVGGAQAVAALAYGAGEIPACDAIVGPGNRFVTAAKKLVAGRVSIDMLAGPSELVVVANGNAPSDWVAADLLAQAEHDPDALPVLVALDEGVIEKVNLEIGKQLETLPTAEIARQSLQNGFAISVGSIEEAAAVSDRIAPEHLEIMTDNPKEDAKAFRHFGALFLGAASAEVLGDYGAGPNHVLPTGGTGRFVGGLSVFHFLRIRTWMHVERPEQATGLLQDAADLAEMEGLAGHKRAAEIRKAK